MILYGVLLSYTCFSMVGRCPGHDIKLHPNTPSEVVLTRMCPVISGFVLVKALKYEVSSK